MMLKREIVHTNNDSDKKSRIAPSKKPNRAVKRMDDVLKEEINHAMATDGFYIIRGFFDMPDIDIEGLKNEVREAIDTHPIFNNSNLKDQQLLDSEYGPIDVGDGKRKQLFLKDAEASSKIRKFASLIIEKLECLYPRRRIPRDTVYLLSEEECKHQSPHTDWDAIRLSKLVKDDGIFGGYPAGAIFALEDNTYFNAWPGSIIKNPAQYTNKKSNITYPYMKITLNAGDLLLFRADLIHSGSAFNESNLRIHCFLDSPNIKREANMTYDVSPVANLSPIKS